MTSIILELDDKLQAKLENYASRHGQSLPESATNLINMGFEIIDERDLDGPYTEEEERLFYSPSNLIAIDEGIRQLEAGEVVKMSLKELRATLK